MTTHQLKEPVSSNQVFAGAWHNQNNSEMVLMVGADGSVSGSIRLDSKQPGAHAYPLTGFACGEAIAFSVYFPCQNSVTSWVGHLVHDEADVSLHTLWHMAVNTGHHRAGDSNFNSLLSGADLFQRGPRSGSMLWQKAMLQPLVGSED